VKNTSTQVSPGTVAKLRYDAFGNIVGGSGTWAGNEAHGGGFGYQTDSTGLQLLGHRWYDPLTGRFISKDPIGSGDNWYVYCENNPLVYADPTGLQLRVGEIKSISRHAIKQIMGREGNGVSNKAIMEAIRNGERVVNTSRGVVEITGKNSVLVVNSKTGNLITVWPTNSGGHRYAVNLSASRGAAFRGSGGSANAIVTIILGADALYKGLGVVITYRKRYSSHWRAIDDPEVNPYHWECVNDD